MQARLLVLVLGLLCSGCGKAGMSDARMSHLLDADHGWLDLTVVSTAPAGAKPSAATGDCALSLTVNGEQVLRESGDYVAATALGNSLGYRFPVPAGKLELMLDLAGCGTPKSRTLHQTFTVSKDQLQSLTLQDGVLRAGEHSEYQPASLDEVRAQLKSVDAELAQTRQGLTAVSNLVWVCLALNALLVLLLLVSWRRRPGK
jgi:hypothetical protein